MVEQKGAGRTPASRVHQPSPLLSSFTRSKPPAPPSGAEALRLSQPRSVSRVAQAFLGGFASPDPPTQTVDQPHKTLLETHSETSLWYIRCPIPCYSFSGVLLPLGGCHGSPSCNLGSLPNQAQGCKSIKVWMLRNEVTCRSRCVSSSDAFRDQAGNRHSGEMEPQQPALYALPKGIPVKKSL